MLYLESILQNYDAILVAEWGRGEELKELLEEQGFTVYLNMQTIRGLTTMGRRQRGAGKGEGIAILVRNEISSRHFVKHTPYSSWVQLSVGDKKVALGSAYIHPDSSAHWGSASGGGGRDEAKEAAFMGIREDLTSMKSIMDHVLLMGDFNARVGPHPDIDVTVQALLDQMGLESDEVVSSHIPTQRACKDSVMDNSGKMLVTHCCLETGCVLKKKKKLLRRVV